MLETRFEKNMGLFTQYKTTGEALEARARVIPDAPAAILGDVTVKNRELYESANSLANFLLDKGYKKGDVVALLCYNVPEYLAVVAGCMNIGVLPASGVSTRYTPMEMEYAIKEIEPNMLILHEDFVDAINQIRQNLKVKDYVVIGKNVPSDMINYGETLAKYPKTKPKIDWEIKPDDDGPIVMTGGTTGYPKGVVERADSSYGFTEGEVVSVFEMLPLVKEMLPKISEGTIKSVLKSILPQLAFAAPMLSRILKSQRTNQIMKSIVEYIYNSPILTELGMVMTTRFLNTEFIYRLVRGRVKEITTSALYHAGGISAVWMTDAIGGCPIFFTRKRGFSPEEFCEIVDREKPMMAYVIGDSMFKPLIGYLREHKGEYDLSSIILLFSSGTIFSEATKKELPEYFPNALLADAFGSTEGHAGAVGGISMPEDETFETSRLGNLNYQKTWVTPEFALRYPPTRVINPETVEDVKPGEIGELIVPNNDAKRYWRDPERTAKTFRVIDGKRYCFMGDACRVDEQGNIYVVGRMTGSINTGGEKVYPPEVEDVIRTYPPVDKISVLGIPDERWGEVVTAVVQLAEGKKATSEEIRDHCRGKLAGFKIPKHVVFVDLLPESGEEKALLPKVKEIAIKSVREGKAPAEEELIKAYKEGRRDAGI